MLYKDYHTALYQLGLRGRKRLHNLTLDNKVEDLERALQEGDDPDVIDKKGGTPLMLAVIEGYMDIVRMLISHGANLDMKTEDQAFTALHIAIVYENLALAQELLHAGANPNATSNGGVTPLMLAVAIGNVELVNCLLSQEKFINIDKNDTDGVTALNGGVYMVIHEEDPKIRRRILDSLYPIIKAGALVNIRDSEGLTPVAQLCFSGTNYLSPDENTGLMFHLLEAKANPDKLHIDAEMTNLQAAISNLENMEVAELLITHGINCNAHCEGTFGPLHYAAKSGNRQLAELLVSKRANVNAKDRKHCGPLHYAAKSGNRKLVELLVSKGANVNTRDRGHLGFFGKSTAADYAKKSGHVELEEWLRKKMK